MNHPYAYVKLEKTIAREKKDKMKRDSAFGLVLSSHGGSFICMIVVKVLSVGINFRSYLDTLVDEGRFLFERFETEQGWLNTFLDLQSNCCGLLSAAKSARSLPLQTVVVIAPSKLQQSTDWCLSGI